MKFIGIQNPNTCILTHEINIGMSENIGIYVKFGTFLNNWEKPKILGKPE